MVHHGNAASSSSENGNVDHTGRKSIALLTMHKAASTYVGSVLRRLFERCDYRAEDIAAEAFEAGTDEVSYIQRHLSRLGQPNTFFGPFRTESAVPVSSVVSVRPIIHIRDPRDCVVSLYYSLAYSHVEPGPGPIRDQFLADRRQFQQMGIDDFCFEGLRRGYDALGIMRRGAEARPDAVLSRYEDMVTDFPNWLERLAGSVDITVDKDILDTFCASTGFNVVEDPLQHKRQVIPGDHRRKLRQNTQDALTEAFKDDLSFFGYTR
ncbi:sulfotransferase domain-containing protein [Pararobbsia alpina]|uniref:sulfotransferase domain-containing protein n=1 Tax=Pararobbsia alpina TaxID=621374 RepID=UPI001582DA3D|nr:sulfotransferase domain-containing protein [Pararobbsia alpina]